MEDIFLEKYDKDMISDMASALYNGFYIFCYSSFYFE